MNELPQHVAEAFLFAQACWPKSIPAGTEATMVAWAPKLAPFELDELRSALFTIAETGDFPTLSEWLDVLEQQRRHREIQQRQQQPKLAAPASTVQRRLEEFDRSAAENRSRQHAELAAAQRHAYRINAPTLSPEQLALAHAEIDKVGEWEMAARKVLAEGYEPGHAAQVFVQVGTEQFLRATVRPKPKRDPSAVLQQTEAQRIAAEYHSDPASWPEENRAALSPGLRKAVSEELARLQTVSS